MLNSESSRHLPAGVHYRPEIDGIRAIAVAAVMIYHAFPHVLPGGFLGVDVFFVLSGYLITQILVREFAKGEFSLMRFYERRARRILPALFFLLFIVMILGFFLNFPYQNKNLFQAFAAVSLFSSNILFWKTTDYFLGQGNDNPLLHTWSLGVEEQFYIFFPIILLFIWKIDQRRPYILLLIILLLSFGLSEWCWWSGKITFGFYSVSTRAWELMIGSLLVFLPALIEPAPWRRELFSLGGLIMVIGSFFIWDPTSPISSFWIAIPVIGTAFLICFSHQSSHIGKILAFPLMVQIGLISYSAYLWHVPLIVFAKNEIGSGISSTALILILISSLVVAYASWRWIETPFRWPKKFSQKTIFTYSILGTSAFLCLGLAGYSSQGFISLYDSEIQKWNVYADKEANGNWVTAHFDKMKGDFTSQNSNKILIIGDSFAQDLLNGIVENNYFAGSEIKAAYVPFRCQLYLGTLDINEFREPRNRSFCSVQRSLQELLPLIHQASIIFLVSDWQKWAAVRLPETIQNLKLREHQKLYVIGSKSFGEIQLKKYMKLNNQERLSLTNEVSSNVFAVNQLLAKNLSSLNFINILDLICFQGRHCPLFFGDGKLISYDGGHLTKEGAVYLIQKLFHETQLKELIPE